MGKQVGYDKLNMYDFFGDAGFEFSNEILSRYYLSLKTKPFVILTGISGTGKTKIAQLFAEYMCQDVTPEKKKNRIAFIPVRPDWMDNRGLLGYYNVLQEKYVKTPLLELLLAAKANPGEPHFIILDEMNLAKVEYYFSDFLSIMESRTPGNEKGEAIFLYDKDQKKDKSVPYEIHIPQNVYFTGTVNVDESTYMFSPKVLDRANVIEFNQVILNSEKQGISTNKTNTFTIKEPNVIKELDTTTIKNKKYRFSDLKGSKELVDCSNAIVDLLKVLEPHNMHFGYRVADEMANFIIFSKDNIIEFDWEEALDIQILQKILPKWHGTRAKLEKPLEDVLAFCIEHNFLRCVKKLKNMQKNLEQNGYTSFIE